MFVLLMIYNLLSNILFGDQWLMRLMRLIFGVFGEVNLKNWFKIKLENLFKKIEKVLCDRFIQPHPHFSINFTTLILSLPSNSSLLIQKCISLTLLDRLLIDFKENENLQNLQQINFSQSNYTNQPFCFANFLCTSLICSITVNSRSALSVGL